MTIQGIEYGFQADINAYMSATALEELTTCLRRIGEATDYKEAIAALTELGYHAQWHGYNLDNNEEPRPCHKDSMAFNDKWGK